MKGAAVLLTLCVLAMTVSTTEAWWPWNWQFWYGKVTYTVEKKLVNINTSCNDWFSQTVVMYFKWNTKLFNIMEEAALVNDNFNFTFTMYDPPLGAFITCINDLCQDATNNYYWGIVRRANDGSDCLLPVGVSTYEPEDGQHIVFTYTRQAMFSTIPQCDGGTGNY